MKSRFKTGDSLLYKRTRVVKAAEDFNLSDSSGKVSILENGNKKKVKKKLLTEVQVVSDVILLFHP